MRPRLQQAGDDAAQEDEDMVQRGAETNEKRA
jgi:hypothetical protein